MKISEVPVPPADLLGRVSVASGTLAEREADFVRGGVDRHDAICAALPPDWTFEGKAILDFGCGPGRVLPHFRAEAETARSFQGCDIDAESITWLSESLPPPFKVFLNKEDPPLPLPDASLDLIYATSVFTHLHDTWGAWIAELHRLLAPGGLLFMTYLGCDAFADRLIEGPWTEDDFGLTTLVQLRQSGTPSPVVLLSEWWIRAHLTRGFEVLSLQPEGFGTRPGRPGRGQGMLVLRRNGSPKSADEWLAPDPDDPREWKSAQFNLMLLRRVIWSVVDQATSERRTESTADARASYAARLRRRLSK